MPQRVIPLVSSRLAPAGPAGSPLLCGKLRLLRSPSAWPRQDPSPARAWTQAAARQGRGRLIANKMASDLGRSEAIKIALF